MPQVDPEPLSRTALKAQRLKPAPGQEPVKQVWSHKRREHIELFDPRQCVPMREKRPPSAAQLAALEAGRRKLTHADCADCGYGFELYMLDQQGVCPTCADLRLESKQRARDVERQATFLEMVNRAAPGRTVYLDTETTGLSCSGGDELVEISVVDDGGNVLLDSLVKPTRHTEWPEAQAIHGITPADVANAPSLEKLLPRLQAIIEDSRALVIYNASFDLAFLPDSLRLLASGKALCAMQAFSLYAGEWDERRQSYRWYKLVDAACSAGHQWDGSAHRARADAMATRSVWRWLCSGVR
ncbi:3'-5' exonuclease [Pseudomonas aeruginosa]|uniref:3'-5' exonuclease n=2 Tax=Pseudomonas aeruginosa TaxID=287 RepID=UPI000F5153E1|nr:3'-5' exonuclease [Pseudomonas aeruginosa]AYW42369.1 3'-5' exonuclease [Pseudomonas aeruginosa]HCL4034706.1 3'-5' exonuclease [Pseudomonas aeruginosa]